MIELKHVSKSFESCTPLKDVNAVINKGDVIAVIGGSGTGKSTLLRCINLMNPPTSGEVLIDGVNVTAPGYDAAEVRRKIGMVFQTFNLFSNLTVIENIMLPQIEVLKKGRQEAYDRAVELLEEVGLQKKQMKYPDELSGGQKQRVAIARTLALDPEIILFDEPTSALDPAMVREVLYVIQDLARRGTTMMIVTHEMQFARKVSNRVFFLADGIIYEEGTPDEIFTNPKKDKTRQFVTNIDQIEYEGSFGEYSYIDYVSKVTAYCEKLRISRERELRLSGIIDEMSQVLLKEALDEFSRVKFTCEYSAKDDALSFTAAYDGKAFDVRNAHDELSVKLLMSKLKDYEYRTSAEGYTNQIVISL